MCYSPHNAFISEKGSFGSAEKKEINSYLNSVQCNTTACLCSKTKTGTKEAPNSLATESLRSEKERCDEIVVNILLVPIFENMLLASNLKYSPFQHLMSTMCAIKLKALQNSGDVIYVLHTCGKKQ